MKNRKTDPTMRALRKVQQGGGIDILQPPRRAQSEATHPFPLIRGTIEEVDQQAALVVLRIAVNAAGDDDPIDLPSSVRAFRGMTLLSPSGQKCGTITTATIEDDGGEIELIADLDNTSVLSSLSLGEFTSCAVIAQRKQGMWNGGSYVYSITPLSVRLVAAVSDVNNPRYPTPAAKSFRVRRDDGRLEKRDFQVPRHMGTGFGSGSAEQQSVFKAIHATGGRPLSEGELMKISTPNADDRRLRKDAKRLTKLARNALRKSLR